jgi:hypothetical protein
MCPRMYACLPGCSSEQQTGLAWPHPTHQQAATTPMISHALTGASSGHRRLPAAFAQDFSSCTSVRAAIPPPPSVLLTSRISLATLPTSVINVRHRRTPHLEATHGPRNAPASSAPGPQSSKALIHQGTDQQFPRTYAPPSDSRRPSMASIRPSASLPSPIN